MNRFSWATSWVCAACVFGCGTETAPKPITSTTSAETTSSESASIQTDSTQETSKAKAAEPKSRKFTFHYRFKVKDLKPSDDADKNVVRVWLPVAPTTEEQDVQRLPATAPSELIENTEGQSGNKILFFEAKIPESGELSVDVPYEVARREVLRGPKQPQTPQVATLDHSRRDFFLRADTMVPVEGKPLKLLDMIELVQDKFARARQLYDIVDNHVAYKKDGIGWGRGDTNWVCDSRYGNCTDFHSLFISLARSQGLPSRFEIGFSIPTDKPEGPIAGYHCWAWFYADERGWIPVDISEADKNPKMKEYYFGSLTPDRVTFSTGRDLELVPKAESQPLNFFIYPHIEVGGKTLPKENVELQFGFKNQS